MKKILRFFLVAACFASIISDSAMAQPYAVYPYSSYDYNESMMTSWTWVSPVYRYNYNVMNPEVSNDMDPVSRDMSYFNNPQNSYSFPEKGYTYFDKKDPRVDPQN